MGIGRREFLRLAGIALGGLALDPLTAAFTSHDIYINKKLGILFHKPASWEFVHVKDFGKLRDAQILADGWEDVKEQVWEELGEPICVVTKYALNKPGYYGVFSPTITLDITPKQDLNYLNYGSMEELMEMSFNSVSQYLREFRLVKEHEPTFISGYKFYEYDAEYLFEHKELDQPVKAELKVLKAEHNGFYYDFNCHQCAAQGQTARLEFESFKKSIKLI